MHKFRTLLLVLGTAASLPAFACVEILPDHPQVVAAAETVYEATVLPSSTAKILRLKVTGIRKGTVAQTTSVPIRDCSVPQFPAGFHVIVVQFSAERYVVVPNQSSTGTAGVGR